MMDDIEFKIEELSCELFDQADADTPRALATKILKKYIQDNEIAKEMLEDEPFLKAFYEAMDIPSMSFEKFKSILEKEAPISQMEENLSKAIIEDGGWYVAILSLLFDDESLSHNYDVDVMEEDDRMAQERCLDALEDELRRASSDSNYVCEYIEDGFDENCYIIFDGGFDDVIQPFVNSLDVAPMSDWVANFKENYCK